MSRKVLELSLSFLLIVCSASMIAAVIGMRASLDRYQKIKQVQRQSHQSLLKSTDEIREIVTEAGMGLSVRILEKQGLIRPTDADQLVLESIGRIEEKSERLGKIAKYVNDEFEIAGKAFVAKIGTTSHREKDLGVRKLSFKAVSGSFVESSKAGQLFVIKGMVINNYPKSRSFILVKGSIVDDKGNLVNTKLAYAGNLLTENHLKEMSIEEINQELKDRLGKGKMNVNIQPEAAVPFMIVFDNLADNLSEFTVEAVSSSP